MAFTTNGFRSWKKVNDGKNCAFLNHIGKDPNSSHKVAMQCYHDLENSLQHLDKIIEVQNSEQVAKIGCNFKFQAVAFRGHDESLDSNNRGNFIELIKHVSSYYEKMAAVVLDNAPRNASYTSPMIQKEILSTTSQEVIPVEQFFTYLSLLINLISSSCKRVDQLRVARAARITELIAIDELETEYKDICYVLIDVINYGNTSTQRSEADRVYDFMTSFDFVLVMHMMRDILGFAQVLSQALQCKFQDILNAFKLVSVTKDRLQSYRDNGWNELFTNVKTFCDARNIEMPDINVIYKAGRGRIRKQNDPITMECHYRIDMFLATVDSQILEMKNRFKEDVIELLILSSALHPKDNFQAFNIEQICQLVNKFYSADFTDQEKLHLRTQLELFQIEFSCNSQLQNLSSLQELCQVSAKTRKSMCYTLIDRLIRLILTLPVSTATTERAFSVMKIIKTCLHSRMEEDFFANSMIMYIEKEIAKTFDINSIIDDFDKIKSHRAQFHMSHTVK
ncbi:uncharacterized protein LOC113749245 [Coffea eugenioides]|uniref:uncharacterized protein LOC113749245 n=1 Tax=Coffea eugenioides TaxID=49369 RepID=UPI000F60ABE8|nr:uncharacterized protein LOC113749245 [Coffea eugenioides]